MGKLTLKELVEHKLSGFKLRLDAIERAHNELRNLVNSIVMPNIQDLQKLASQVLSTNPIILKHTIYMDIIVQKLNISEQDYQEAEARIRNRAAKGTQSVRVQSTPDGTNESSRSDGQPGVLDAPGGGIDDAGSGDLSNRDG